MGEPVGNSPRRVPDRQEIIPPNSHKEREVKPTTSNEPPKLTQITSAPVFVVKPPWYKRAARTMVADDAQTIREYLILDVLVPNLKNLLRDIVVGGIDRSLYGGNSIRSTRGSVISSSRGSSMSIRTKYDQMGNGNDPRPQLSRVARANHDFEEIGFISRQEAIDTIAKLQDRINEYGWASVADLYDLTGRTSDWPDRDYGWRDLSNADVRQYRDGFRLELPKPSANRS